MYYFNVYQLHKCFELEQRTLYLSKADYADELQKAKWCNICFYLDLHLLYQTFYFLNENIFGRIL